MTLDYMYHLNSLWQAPNSRASTLKSQASINSYSAFSLLPSPVIENIMRCISIFVERYFVPGFTLRFLDYYLSSELTYSSIFLRILNLNVRVYAMEFNLSDFLIITHVQELNWTCSRNPICTRRSQEISPIIPSVCISHEIKLTSSNPMI